MRSSFKDCIKILREHYLQSPSDSIWERDGAAVKWSKIFYALSQNKLKRLFKFRCFFTIKMSSIGHPLIAGHKNNKQVKSSAGFRQQTVLRQMNTCLGFKIKSSLVAVVTRISDKNVKGNSTKCGDKNDPETACKKRGGY